MNNKFVLLGKAPLKGDANGDGEFNIADAVTLQNWLLSKPDTELRNQTSADICTDGRIDVFDMILMRKLFIENGAL